MIAPGKTLTEIFKYRIAQSSGKVAFKRKVGGVWEEITFHEYATFVEEICFSLIESGIQRGDRVALLSNTRMEWALADFAILSVGAITVPIYQSSIQEDVAFILQNSEAKAIFVEDELQLRKVLAVKSKLPFLKLVILIQHGEKSLGETSFVTFEEFCQKGRHFKEKHAGTTHPTFVSLLDHVKPKDIVSIVYTSGTTGQPKGVVLTHENFISELSDVAKAFPELSDQDIVLSFLPYAHIFGRVEHFCGAAFGWTAAFAESIQQLVSNLPEIRPSFMFSVPRIYEKVYNKIIGQVSEGSFLKKKIFYWSLNIGRTVSQQLQKGLPVGLALKVKYTIAKKLVFEKLQKKFGGRLRFFISGGAPLSSEIAEFFHAAGFLILEGYGLTETSAAVFVNRPHDFEFGTVGPPLEDVQVKIAEDGEVLVKSKKIFREYYKNPQASEEAFENGWYHTGDIGFINEKNHLKITDRKKDIIVTSGGKNVAPQKIENLLKTERFISQAMIYGDKKNYLTALITLNPEEITTYAKSQGIPVNGNIHEHPKVQRLIGNIIGEKNKSLSPFETIKKFQILKDDFSVETGELTPSLKIRRRFCAEKYKDVLSSMYL